ncbi:uncharacterized protein BP5553_04454 [Venustampulla echinocandica]|uniref:DUF6594 domain-containing protein n=1 Tax=Venustampulla echinocandica TaxID=2656787 RepID=A0A370TNB9_9HELO|nr:uncharacterized protein BP5553_04454 [Venustampulla echinocandica]RDL37021.1 hypothetical protein BP5553_04454 [Venustampulla echinocandica]
MVDDNGGAKYNLPYRETRLPLSTSSALSDDDLEMQSMRNRNHTTPKSAVDGGGREESLPQLSPPRESNPNTNENNGSISSSKLFWRRLLNSRYLFGPTAEETRRLNHLFGYDRLVYKPVECFPKGYPQFAAFMGSDDSFANYRQFSRLSARILLHLQNELTELEKELDALDMKDAADPIMRNRLYGLDDFPGCDSAQKDLMSAIKKKYIEFTEVFSKAAELHSLGRSTPRDHRSVLHWVMSRTPFAAGKYDFVFHADDFVSLSRQSQNGRKFDNLIESCLGEMPWPSIKYLLQTPKERSKTQDPFVTHYSPSRLTWLVKSITVSLAVGILFVPVYLLFLVPMSRAMMAGISSIFVFAFAVLLSVITDAKMQEVFAGSAAYAAVLITFLGNIDNLAGSRPA